MARWNSLDYSTPGNYRRDNMYRDDIFSDLFTPSDNMARTVPVGSTSFDYQPRAVAYRSDYVPGYAPGYRVERGYTHVSNGYLSDADDPLFYQTRGRGSYRPQDYDDADFNYLQTQRQAELRDLQRYQTRSVRPYITNPTQWDPGYDQSYDGRLQRNYPQERVYRRPAGSAVYDREWDWDYFQPERQIRRERPEIVQEPPPRYCPPENPSRTLPSQPMCDYDWQVYDRLARTAQKLEGQVITDYDKRVTVRLGCARAVSLMVEQAYGIHTTDINVRQMEKHLLNQEGFRKVALNDIKPGDLILAYREENDYPHAAVYMGNAKIFNNDSNLGYMTTQSWDKLNSPEYKRFVVLRRPDRVPAVPVG